MEDYEVRRRKLHDCGAFHTQLVAAEKARNPLRSIAKAMCESGTKYVWLHVDKRWYQYMFLEKQHMYSRVNYSETIIVRQIGWL